MSGLFGGDKAAKRATREAERARAEAARERERLQTERDKEFAKQQREQAAARRSRAGRLSDGSASPDRFALGVGQILLTRALRS